VGQHFFPVLVVYSRCPAGQLPPLDWHTGPSDVSTISLPVGQHFFPALVV